MKNNYLSCPSCNAGLTAEANTDYFESTCPCCSVKFAVQRDESGLCETWEIRKKWLFPFNFVLP